MADTYTQSLKARKIEQGAYPDSYATRFNEDMVDILDAGINGVIDIDIGSSTTYALEAMQNGTLSESHYWRLNFTGTPASAVTVTVPASVTPSKNYLVSNETGQTLTIKYAATSGVAIRDGQAVQVHCDGTTVGRLAVEQSGSWTAAIRGSSTAGTYEIASQICRYTRIGRRVWLDVGITMAGAITGGGVGDLTITGLPFAKVGSSYPVGSVLLSGVDWTAGASLSLAFTGSGAFSTLVITQTIDNSAFTGVPIGGLGAGDLIFGSICYETDDP